MRLFHSAIAIQCYALFVFVKDNKMALIDRLLGTEDPKLPVHQFMAALAEYKRGAITGANIVSAFGLSAGEAISLQSFLNNLDSSSIDRTLIHDVLLLGESGYYTKTQVTTRLGI